MQISSLRLLADVRLPESALLTVATENAAGLCNILHGDHLGCTSLSAAPELNRFRNLKIADLAQKCKGKFCIFGVSDEVCLMRTFFLRKFGAFDYLNFRNFRAIKIFIAFHKKKQNFLKNNLAICAKSRYCRDAILSY